MAKNEIEYIKKLDGGDLAVKWKGKSKVGVIKKDDEQIQVYLVYMIVHDLRGQEQGALPSFCY